MPIQLLSSPTELRRTFKRLVRTAERIDLFTAALSDEELTTWLAAAAERGAAVRVTTNVDDATAPDCLETLLRAGVDVGVFAPATHRRRDVLRFKPGVVIFDNEREWWTAAILGSFAATEDSLSRNLEAATLVEASSFDGEDDEGAFLLKLVRWGKSINHDPLDRRQLNRYRKRWEAARPAAAPPPGRTIEAKPLGPTFVSPLSWQELRRCDWATYWSALLEADRLQQERTKQGLTGARGWLFGLDVGHAAFARGPEAWIEDGVHAELLGRTPATSLLGRVSGRGLSARVREDAAFRLALHAAIERCVVDPSPATMRDALAPLVGGGRVTVPELSRLLAIAAPDRFLSILDERAQVRMSSVVGFDLAPRDTELQDHLSRYIDAVALIREFPWAAEASAERSSEHPQEPDAWAKRTALLGCLVG